METTAEQLRDAGMQQAIDHADSEAPAWGERAFRFVKAFATMNLRITSEGARKYAERCGLPFPPDKRAWGAVMIRAARAGLIAKIGYTTALDPKVHCNPVTLWESKVYFGKQQGEDQCHP